MTHFDRIIIIAFDGLDHEKIQQYDCKNVMQEEFGRIDLSDMPMVTGPLWSSFITGVYPDDHSVKKTMNWTDDRVQRFENLVHGNPLFTFWKGIRWTVFRNLDSLNAEVLGAYRDNLEVDTTIFEDIEPSIAVNVPGYRINTALTRIKIAKAIGKDAPIPKHVMERDIDAEFMKRKKETFEALEDDFALMMSHFHKPDFMQHLFAFDQEKEEAVYREMDDLAAKILKKTTDDDLVIFCSDHGLEDGGHRDQAFYSLNHDLGWENPHITEFRDLLSEIEVRKASDMSGIDI